jgi:hypothetical protein
MKEWSFTTAPETLLKMKISDKSLEHIANNVIL